MRTSVVSRGHNISYRTEGTGAPLLLLCGWYQWADRWWEAGYVDRLSDRYQIIAIDRLGHGESDKPHDPKEYLEPLIVSDIVAVLDAESVEQALMWGHSLGAVNAASLAELEPHRVAGLVCRAGAPMPRPPERSSQIVAFAENLKTDEGMTAFLEGMGSPAESVIASMKRNDSAALAATLAGSAEWSPSPDEIAAPSLWYAGSEDNGGFTPEAIDAAARLGVETHLMPGADHVATFDAPTTCWHSSNPSSTATAPNDLHLLPTPEIRRPMRVPRLARTGRCQTLIRLDRPNSYHYRAAPRPSSPSPAARSQHASQEREGLDRAG